MTTAARTSWFRAMRTREAMELLQANPCALLLAYIIAYRGQYSDGFNRHGLKLGEALLGDYQRHGMSERQYRTAKEQLAKWRFATFKTTSKGTIGKLIDTRLFSIFRLESDGQKDTRATDSRRTADGRATTTKNVRTEERKELKKGEAPGKRALSPTERISAERERDKIAEELRYLDGQASIVACGRPIRSKQQKDRIKELEAMDRKLEDALRLDL